MATVIEETSLYPFITVLGANASLIAPELEGKNVLIINNNNWQEGIASSIRSAIGVLQQQHPACDGMIIMVCDQPYITSSLIHELINAQKLSGKPMAAC